jgi:hypothetical protein
MNYGKYELWVSTGFAGHNHTTTIDVSDDLTEDKWQAMTENEQSNYIQDYLQEFINESIESGWNEVDD